MSGDRKSLLDEGGADLSDDVIGPLPVGSGLTTINRLLENQITWSGVIKCQSLITAISAMLQGPRREELRTPKARSVGSSCVFLVFWVQVYHQKQTA